MAGWRTSGRERSTRRSRRFGHWSRTKKRASSAALVEALGRKLAPVDDAKAERSGRCSWRQA